MIRVLFLLTGLTLINHSLAQDKSYFKFDPEFSKDTLEIVNIDSLKFDVNIRYSREQIAGVFISGKIGLINKYNIENPYGYFTLFSQNEKKLEFNLVDKNVKLKRTDATKINLIDYNVADFRPIPSKNLNYSIENIKSVVESLMFNLMYFPIRNKQLIFIDEKGNRQIKDLKQTKILVFFNKNDIRYINVLNDVGDLILKIRYKELLSLEK